MMEYFDIFGTPIPFDKIKSFRIVQREYIYRPVYRDTGRRRNRFQFEKMIPYAAIIGDSDPDSSVSKFKPTILKENIIKDVYTDIRTSIGDRFNIKSIRSKKYHCVNQAGRRFSTYLVDVPALLITNEGKASEVYKYDELYKELDENIMPGVNVVSALEIKADEQYIFYGNGIQIDDIGREYTRLKYELSAFKEAMAQIESEKKENAKLTNKVKNLISAFKKEESTSIEPKK